MVGTRSTCGVVLAVVAVLAITSCARGSETVRAGVANPPNAMRLQDRIESTDAAGVTLDVPPPGAEAIPEAKARVAAEKVFGEEVIAGMTPQLALLSNKNMGEVQSDGSVRLNYVDRLVWAYIGRESCDDGGGLGAMGPDGRPTQATFAPNLGCIGVVAVDARSGEYLMGYSEVDGARSMLPQDLGAG
jgi:hypothetical protein